MFSLDTETTGLDFNHGARPFFLTTCDDSGNQAFYQWDVDPLTRRVTIPDDDIRAIKNLLGLTAKWGEGFDEEIQERHVIVTQNGRFDATALHMIGVDNWPWSMMRDTLMAGHLLASNHPHDLTSMAVQYLGVDIKPFEDALQKACEKARRLTRSKYPRWAIAKEGRSDMPSAKAGKEGRTEKDKLWKFDMWLPRALWLVDESVRKEHPEWETVLRDYSNTDSAVTLAVWQAQREELMRRGLWALFMERMKVLPVAFRMERHGVNVSKERLYRLWTDYVKESERLGNVCKGVADSYGYQLKTPQGGVNKNLRVFMTDVMKLEPVYNPKSKTSEPTLNKDAMNHYLATLEERTRERVFVKSLLAKRKRDTAVAYLNSYEKHWIEKDGDLHVLYPSTNPTATDTLRWNYSNPNLQQVSKQESECERCEGDGCSVCAGTGKDMQSLRNVFVWGEDREGYSFDARNVELRLPAYESDEKELIALFENATEPPYYGSEHLLNFHTIYPDIWDEVLQEVGFEKVGPTCKKRFAATWYQWCKNFDFAVGYGAGDATADRAAHRKGSRQRVIQRFARKEKLNQHWIRYADKHGYVETLPDKTVDPKRGYPLLCSRGDWGVLPTVPLNYHVQGTAMWITMKGMLRAEEVLSKWRKEGFDAHLVLQVHDELIVTMPKQGNPLSNDGNERQSSRSNLWRARLLQEVLSREGDNVGVPVPFGCEYHPVSWGEGIAV